MLTRIALISEHASPLATLGGVDSGGQNIYVMQIAKYLAQQGCAVDIFTRRDNEMLPVVADWVDRVRLIHVPAGPPHFVRKEELLPYMDDFASWMIRFFRQENVGYSLIHANFWMSGWVALRIRQQLGIPFVITFHALGRVRRLHQKEADQFPHERQTIEDRLIQEADRLVAECPQDKQDLLRLYHADPTKISIIPCGFDPSEFWPIGKPLARAAIGLAPNQRVLLQLGRLVPRKGIDNIIRALARLQRQHRITAQLVIVGGESEVPDPAATPEIGRLHQIACQEHIAHQVRFMGCRPRDVLKYFYSAADVFLTTPWYEPFGITPLEAMACGTPVVASSVGGLKFTVRHGDTGYLVPPEDPDALARQIAQLYEDPDLLQRFRQRSIQYVNRYFTWQHITRSLLQMYRRVVGSQSSVSFGELVWRGDRRVMERRRLLAAMTSVPIAPYDGISSATVEEGADS